jgi:hypothetical protein
MGGGAANGWELAVDVVQEAEVFVSFVRWRCKRDSNSSCGQGIQNHNWMKQLIFVAFVALFPFSQVLGETEIEMKEYSASLVNKFKSLPAKEAFEFWMQNQEPTQASNEILRFSLENDRIGFLQLLFENRSTYSYVIDFVEEMPPSDRRDKMVILMLRWDCQVFWHNEVVENDDDFSHPIVLDNAIEPFVGVIRKYLPALEVDETLFSTKEKRMKLAADLEDAMGGWDSKYRGERPKKRNELSEAAAANSANSSKVTKQPTDSHASSWSTSQPKSILRWAWMAGLLLVGSLLWMLSSKRKRS